MVEEQKEKGFVKDREITVTEVELKVNRNNAQAIDKITFICGTGNITWKPSVSKINYEGGFKVESKVSMERDMIPKKLSEIAMICSEQKECKVKASYNWWKTEQDGQLVTYRFILSEKTFENWEIIKTEVKEEQIAP